MTETPPALAIDAHAHFYPCYDAETFLDTAARRLRRAAAGRPATAYLLLAGVRGQDPLGALLRHSPRESAWSMAATGAEHVLLARRRDGCVIVLIGGDQIATADGLEVLAFGGGRIPVDASPFADAVAAAVQGAPIVVVPWGFGKWRGARATAVFDALQRYGARLFLGDTIGRPAFDPGRTVFAHAGGHAARRLFGSDPLPFPDHARRVAHCGTIVPGRADLERPLASLVEALDAARTFTPFGEGPGVLRFTRDQLRLRLRRVAPNRG